jgi:tRNA(Glu) U13 pseudouridine synthase TruD
VVPGILLAALERLWGIEPPGLKPATDAVLWVERPRGFRVFEPKPLLAPRGSWAVYLVSREALDSVAAARILAGLLGARRYSLQGLKDACARAFQYISLEAPRRTPESLVHGRLKAWLVGWRGDPLRVGGHGFNMFTIDVDLDDPGMAGVVCDAFKSIRWIPGLYGPQRFGVERPNTHYYGLKALTGEWGDLLREYSTRYPLEPRRGPGGYEARAIERARREAAYTIAGKTLPGIALEALQAYIFNRTLSRALALGLEPESLAGSRVRVACPQGLREVPAARLPPGGSRGANPWARLMARILCEEGVPLDAFKLSGLSSPLRPVLYPVCRLYCRIHGPRIRLHVVLPAGAYATILLRMAGWVDWLRYSACSPAPGQPSL